MFVFELHIFIKTNLPALPLLHFPGVGCGDGGMIRGDKGLIGVGSGGLMGAIGMEGW